MTRPSVLRWWNVSSTDQQAVSGQHGGAGTTSKLLTDVTQDLPNIRSRTCDIFVAHAHAMGSAIRYGCMRVRGLKGSPIKGLADAKGKRLGLPTQDSVVTDLLRGEVNALNTYIKRHLGVLYQARYQAAMPLCLQIRRCDVVVVEKLQEVLKTCKSPSMNRDQKRDGARSPGNSGRPASCVGGSPVGGFVER